MGNTNNFGRIRIQHAGIHVKNMEETVKWYQDVLGFELLPPHDDGRMMGAFPKCWMLRNGDFYLEVYEVLNAREYSFVDYEYTLGVKHLSFSVEKFDEFIEHLYARGDVEILVDNHYPGDRCGIEGGDRAVYIKDNNGILVELTKVHDRV